MLPRPHLYHMHVLTPQGRLSTSRHLWRHSVGHFMVRLLAVDHSLAFSVATCPCWGVSEVSRFCVLKVN